MKLTPKFLGLLNRVFDKDPDPFIAFRVRCAGGLTWTVAEGVLTLTYGGADHTYDLGSYTLQSLAAALAALPGFVVTSMTTRSNLSALVLLDGAGDQSASNGDALLGYTSILWAFIEAWSRELQTLRDAVDQALLQLSTTTASGAWLDEVGSYYGVPRTVGEGDRVYGQRIIAQTLRPISNNVAIEKAIEDFTGQPCTVDDVVVYVGVTPLYDGSIQYDGTHTYNAVPAPKYGLFDVATAYDLIQGGDIRTFQATVTAVVEKLRASGTHLRALALESATPINDDFPFSPTDTFVGGTGAAGSGVVISQTDTLTAPTETVAGFVSQLGDLGEAGPVAGEAYAGTVYSYVRTGGGDIITDDAGAPLLANLGPLFA